MPFFIERYLRALAARRRWLPIILLLPVFYLAVAAARQDLFVIEQDFVVNGDPAIQPALRQALHDPVAWLLDETALAALERKLRTLQPTRDPVPDLWRLLPATLSLTLAENGQPRLRYTGYNPALGGMLVDFFGQRLQTGAATPGALAVDGPPRIVAYRGMWRDYRAIPAATLLLISLVAFLLVVAVLELLDPSFKSERQMARYLGLPMLGALPDIDLLMAHPTFDPERD